ncbi:hypothetical protein EST35_0284 [Pseudomonas phage vB_PaeM_PA5oct]|uniref:Uncharacterized protein n=1 Tax=Pseudomonas phage vB_PaeM_PA5oct TaxID=2163605 RepID=A0A4Y5JUY3_9CAUD|nr:hypothetical protein PQE65_gp200 [Pseudomonas phage vB_PaeM_PA5oct]QCG76165.1 hypothetical protein EST35_0284 [Pseudomonas phage vB_PaeM_PA5oct]
MTKHWDLSKYSVDIGGEDGNVFFLVAKIKRIIQELYSTEDSIIFTKMAWFKDYEAIGIDAKPTYSDILNRIIELTNITYISTYKLPLDDVHYTLYTTHIL